MASRRIYAPASALHRAALEWIAADRDRPFFLYLHASDPHAPYTPGPEWARRFERLDLRPADPAALNRPFLAIGRNRKAVDESRVAWLRSRYDAEVAEFDAEFGRFVRGLRAAGVLDDTLIVFLADHGEEFYEHQGFSHGNTLYQEQLHVPLVIRFPDRAHAGTRVASLARQIDVLPTVLEYLHLPVPDDVDGESLVPLLQNREPEARVALSHTALGPKDLSSVTTRDWQVIFGRGGGRRRPAPKPVEAFDRRNDPYGHVDVAGSSEHRVAYARQVVAAGTGPGREAVPIEQTVGSETLQKLRALGYVGP
jgi:arylsulfatase A-like enzyme